LNTTNWKDVAELIGIAAIVASLIFVGLQMKQSHEIAIADQYQARADAALGFHLSGMENSHALQNVALGIQDGIESGRLGNAIRQFMEVNGPEMAAVRSVRYRSLITMYDNYHFQYEQGFLTESSWQAFRTRIKSMLSDDVFREFHESLRGSLRGTFEAECDRILEEIAEEGTNSGGT
jgi:hypothetical protein